MAWSLNALGLCGSTVSRDPPGVWRPLPCCTHLVWFTPGAVTCVTLQYDESLWDGSEPCGGPATEGAAYDFDAVAFKGDQPKG